MTEKNGKRCYLVVCVENKLDEVYLLPPASNLKQTVINGFTAYRQHCFTGEDNLQTARESYHAVLYDYVHNPIGYSDHSYSLMTTDETGTPAILDLEALLEDMNFWEMLS